jgi:primosomal replication protein N
MADVATQLAREAPGARIRVRGFLNRRNRVSAQLVLHATQTEILKDTNHGDDEPSCPR